MLITNQEGEEAFIAARALQLAVDEGAITWTQRDDLVRQAVQELADNKNVSLLRCGCCGRRFCVCCSAACAGCEHTRRERLV